MVKNYALKINLLALGLGGMVPKAGAQAWPPDSLRWAAPPQVLLKAGLRLKHFSYSGSGQSWQFVVPLSVGAEYRLTSRLACYGQADADLQASRELARRGARRNVLPSAALGLGVRYYYGQPGRGQLRHHNRPFGNYLALEGSVERAELNARYLASNLSRRQTPTSLTPGVYAYWGTQHRLRRGMLYDVNAGLGWQAPPYYNYESPTPTHYDLTAQVNLRVYWGWGN
ncbi:MAG TPA: hypothetical protein VFO93_11055 [Hymenobacter sp.]|uniref:hypothetical protein n=1 Tax=Hymenobacter sp. TaxID=1898978 RepID=UPI002D7ED2B8|nr:hypothetical protein [Hymenobacter sp.]HET9504072.1 hypothetical protein [Hymenobacter sp.]